MTFLVRATLTAVALAAMTAAAPAQTPADHDAHHPGAQTAQAPAPQPAQPGPGMMGPGMMGPGMMGPGMMGPGMMGQMPMMGGPGGMKGMMQGMGPMMGSGAMMGLPFEHVDGRIAFLKAELGITAAQEAPWTAFADAMRQAAGQHRALHEAMMNRTDAAAASWPDRLQQHAAFMASRGDALKALADAAKPLYGVLSDDQKARADRLLSGPMGMM